MKNAILIILKNANKYARKSLIRDANHSRIAHGTEAEAVICLTDPLMDWNIKLPEPTAILITENVSTSLSYLHQKLINFWK